MKKKSLMFVFLFMFLFSITFISAASCIITTPDDCDSADNMVMGVYSSTNTHGLIEGTTFLVLCCDFAGIHTCNGNNKVIGLSDTTNAHAETPEFDNYITDVCFGNLSCIGTTDPATEITSYPLAIMSLSGETNAHIGAYADYTYKILCVDPSSIEPPTANGYWAGYDNYLTEITDINISQVGLGGAANSENTIRIVVKDTEETQGTPVTIKIYEKDEGTGSNDDFITTLSTTINSEGDINFPWTPTYNELNNSDPEAVYEFYFKITIDGQETSYRDKILNLRVLWDFSWSNVDCWWLDFDKTKNISQIIIPAEYIFDSNPGTGSFGGNISMPDSPELVWEIYFSNLVHTAASGLIGTEGTHISFEIFESDASSEDSIRTNENALVGILNSHSGIAIAPWEITPEDIQAAGVEDVYDFLFRVKKYDGSGFSCGEFLRVNVTWDSLIGNLHGFWVDYLETMGLTEVTFEAGNLGGTASELNTVKLRIDEFPTSLEGNTVSFSIYEKNANSYDVIRTRSTAINGTIDSNGSVMVPWTVTSTDIIAAGNDESTYDFYFNISMNNVEIKGFPDQKLAMTINGVINPDNVFENASGEWRDFLFLSQQIHFDYYDGESNIVSIYVWDLNAPEGTEINFTIYEDDFIGRDYITTLNSTINNGLAYALWDMTPEQIQLAGSGGTQSNPWDFYFEVVALEQGPEDFGKQILEVENASGCIGCGSECININFCSDYSDSVNCSNDDCNVTISIPNIDCDAEDLTCYCEWDDSDGCSPAWNANAIDPPAGGIVIGKCSYQENLNEDDCNDGFLSYSWTSIWTWDGGNPGKVTEAECLSLNGGGATEGCVQDSITNLWHYDPETRNELCIDGSNTIACPAQVQLSFGNWVNWLFAIIIILIAYYLIHMSRKNKSKKPTHPKTKKRK